MEQPDITYIIQHKKRRSAGNDRSSYMLLVFPVAFIALGFVPFLAQGPDDKPAADPLWHVVFPVAAFTAGVSLLFFMFRRLRQRVSFTSIATPFTKEENYARTVALYRQQKNVAIQQMRDCIVCNYGISWFSWGEQVTIVPLDKEVLINSHATGRGAITIVKDVNNIQWYRREFFK